MTEYCGYRKTSESGMPVIYGFGKFENGREFFVRVPIPQVILDDTDINIEPMVKETILALRPEDIE